MYMYSSTQNFPKRLISTYSACPMTWAKLAETLKSATFAATAIVADIVLSMSTIDSSSLTLVVDDGLLTPGIGVPVMASSPGLNFDPMNSVSTRLVLYQ